MRVLCDFLKWFVWRIEKLRVRRNVPSGGSHPTGAATGTDDESLERGTLRLFHGEVVYDRRGLLGTPNVPQTGRNASITWRRGGGAGEGGGGTRCGTGRPKTGGEASTQDADCKLCEPPPSVWLFFRSRKATRRYEGRPSMQSGVVEAEARRHGSAPGMVA